MNSCDSLHFKVKHSKTFLLFTTDENKGYKLNFYNYVIYMNTGLQILNILHT
jgi:hypothetical protein